MQADLPEARGLGREDLFGLVSGHTGFFFSCCLGVLMTNPGFHIFWASTLLVLVFCSDFRQSAKLL